MNLRRSSHHALAASLALAIVLASCSGSRVTPVIPSSTPATPSGKAAATAAPSKSLAITLTIPSPAAAASTSRRVAGSRSPKFVAASTAGLLVAAYASPWGTNATPLATTAYNVSASSPSCSATANGTRTCTLAFAAPGGTDDFVATTYDAVPVNGAFPSNANALGTAKLSGIVIGPGGPSTIGFAIGGIAKTIAIGPPRISAYGGTATTIALGVSALDADGNVIIAGNSSIATGSTSQTDGYATPIALAVDDASGHATIAVNGGAPGRSGTLTTSGDTVTLAYDGSAAAGFGATITASAGSISGSTAFAPFFITPQSGSATQPQIVAGSSPAIDFTGAPQSGVFQVTEVGYTGTFAFSGGSCSSNVTVGNSSGGGTAAQSATVSQSATSNCSITVSDGRASVPVAVAQAGSYGGAACSNAPDATIYQGGDGGVYFGMAIYNLRTQANIGYLTGYPYFLAFPVVADPTGKVYIRSTRSSSSGAGADSTVDAVAYTPANFGYSTPTAATFTIGTLPGSLSQLALDGSGHLYFGTSGFDQTTFASLPGSIGEWNTGGGSPIASIASAPGYLGGVDKQNRVWLVSTSPAPALSILAPLGSGVQAANVVATISGSATKLQQPEQIAFDANGNAYVADVKAGILEFAPTANGNVAPLATFAIPGSTKGSGSVAIDAAGNLYADDDYRTIYVWPHASASATPAGCNVGYEAFGYGGGWALGPSAAQLGPLPTPVPAVTPTPAPPLASPPAAKYVYVPEAIVNPDAASSPTQGRVVRYDARTMQPVDTLLLAPAQSASQLPCDPVSVALDGKGNMLVASRVIGNGKNYANCYDQIGTYPIPPAQPGASQTVTATRAIVGSDADATSALSVVSQIALDSNGNVYAANLGNNTVSEFAAGASGIATPIAQVSPGPNGGFPAYTTIGGVALDPTSQLFAGYGGNSSSGIYQFSPLASGTNNTNLRNAVTSTYLLFADALALTPDGSGVFAVDRNAQCIDLFSTSNGRFARNGCFSGTPVGAAVDANGWLYVTLYAGSSPQVVRIDPARIGSPVAAGAAASINGQAPRIGIPAVGQ